MTAFRVLIVEDEPIIALELSHIATDIVSAAVVVVASIAQANDVLDEPFDMALLDVDVTNGKTYELARELSDRHVRCVFISASRRDHLPTGLNHITFIPKPFQPAQIEQAILALLPNGS